MSTAYATKTIRQQLEYRASIAGRLSATQELFNRVAVLYFVTIRAHFEVPSLSNQAKSTRTAIYCTKTPTVLHVGKEYQFRTLDKLFMAARRRQSCCILSMHSQTPVLTLWAMSVILQTPM